MAGDADLRCLACGRPMGEAAACPACGWSYAAEPGGDVAEPPVQRPVVEPDISAPPAETGSPEPPSLGWEVAAVLAVGVVPNVVTAAVYAVHPVPSLPLVVEAGSSIAYSACVAVATLYVMRTAGAAGPGWGWAWPRGRDVAFAVVPFLAALFAWGTSSAFPIPRGEWSSVESPHPVGPAEWLLLAVRTLVSVYAEELVTRAYLVTRLTAVFRSRAGAVVAAAACFAASRLHHGSQGVAEAFALGLVYGVVYLLMPRVWPLTFGRTGFEMLREYLAAE